MQPAPSTSSTPPPVCLTGLLSENSRQGVRSWNPALHPGPNVCNSTVLLGLQFRCSETVSGPVVAPSNQPGIRPVAASPVYACMLAAPVGNRCAYGCNQMVGSFSAGVVVTQSQEQAACPPPRPGCASSIEVIFTGVILPLPGLNVESAQIVPNSCIYSGRKQ